MPHRPLMLWPYAPLMGPVPAPSAAPDVDVAYYAIRREWIPYILGAIEVYRWEDAWILPPQTSPETILGWFNQLCLQLMNPVDCAMKLRQNPSNPCQLQQQQDGQWVTVFDYSLCASDGGGAGTNTIILQNNIQAGINFLTTRISYFDTHYVNSITNIYNELGPSGVNRDARNLALCYAISRLVAAHCQANVDLLNSDRTNEDIAFGLGVASFVVGVVGSIAAAPFTAGASLAGLAFPLGMASAALGFSGAAVSYNDSYIKGKNAETWGDTAAQDEVVCYLYTSWKDSDVTLAAFNSALDGNPFSGNAYDIASTLGNFMNERAAYVAFVEGFNNAFSQAKVGIVLPCPCGSWCYLWDFAGGQGGWVVDTTGGQDARWVGNRWAGKSDGTNSLLSIKRTFSATTITGVKIEGTANGTGASSYNGVWLMKGDGSEVEVGNFVVPASFGNEIVIDPPIGNVTGIRIAAGMQKNTNQSNEITSVQLRGEGVNQFGSDNCI